MKRNKQEPQLQKHDVETEVTTDNSVDESRRKTLKKIAAGGAVAGVLALSGKWGKPVVNSIILPAHAQATNPAPPTAPPTLTTTGAPEGGGFFSEGASFSVQSVEPTYEAAPLSRTNKQRNNK